MKTVEITDPTPQPIARLTDIMHQAGQAANEAAARATFLDYRTRKAPNTIRRQDADLTLFADYLKACKLPAGMITFYRPKTKQYDTHRLAEATARAAAHT